MVSSFKYSLLFHTKGNKLFFMPCLVSVCQKSGVMASRVRLESDLWLYEKKGNRVNELFLGVTERKTKGNNMSSFSPRARRVKKSGATIVVRMVSPNS